MNTMKVKFPEFDGGIFRCNPVLFSNFFKEFVNKLKYCVSLM